jgi:hypothetical protein
MTAVASKVHFINIPSEPGMRGLIGDAKMLKFNLSGICLGEFDVYLGNNVTYQEVDIISILQVGQEIELGYNIDQQFYKKTPKGSIGDIAAIINTLTGVIMVGLRDGVYGGTQYRQYIYVLIKGSVSPNIEL